MNRLLFCLSLFSLALVGCKDPNTISGRLKLHEKTEVKTSKGYAVKLPAAVYRSSVKMTSEGGEISIETTDGSISFGIPAVTAEGEFSIPASSIGQEFGLRGAVQTKQVAFDRIVYGSCIYGTRQEHRCWGDNRGGVTCGWETITIPGKQKERHVGIANVKTLEFNLHTRGANAGNFSGSRTISEELGRREFVGFCERDGW